MKTLGTLSLCCWLLAVCGCETQENDFVPMDTGADATDVLEAVVFTPSPDVTDREIDALLAQGYVEEDLEEMGLIEIHEIVPAESGVLYADDALVPDGDPSKAEWVSDGSSVSFLLDSSDHVNVRHTPAAHSCRYVWYRQDYLPKYGSINVDWYWRVGSGSWSWWDYNYVMPWSRRKHVWAGSDGPTFRYKFKVKSSSSYTSGFCVLLNAILGGSACSEVTTTENQRIYVSVENKADSDC